MQTSGRLWPARTKFFRFLCHATAIVSRITHSPLKRAKLPPNTEARMQAAETSLVTRGLVSEFQSELLSPDCNSLCRYSVDINDAEAFLRHFPTCTSTHPANKTQSDANRSRVFDTGPSLAMC